MGSIAALSLWNDGSMDDLQAKKGKGTWARVRMLRVGEGEGRGPLVCLWSFLFFFFRSYSQRIDRSERGIAASGERLTSGPCRQTVFAPQRSKHSATIGKVPKGLIGACTPGGGDERDGV